MLRQVFHNQGVIYSPPWALDLNFLSEKIDSRIAFSRPSADTRTGPTGRIEIVPAGVPVIDYHPVTKACLGLRIQEQRTNLLTYSEQFDNAAWGKGAACVVTPNSAIAPDGTLSADTIASSGTQASDNRTQQFAALAVSAGTVVTFSVWLRADSPVTTTLRVANLGDGDGSNTATNVTATWQRFTVTQTFTGSSTQVRSCINSQGAAVTLYAWGAQLEVGAFATSYIPTTTAQATRAADVATMPLGSWFNSAEGTLILDADAPETQSGVFRWLLALNRVSNSGADIIGITTPAGTSSLRFAVASGNVASSIMQSAAGLGAPFKMACAYRENDFAVAYSAGAMLTDTDGAVPTALNRLQLGGISDSGAIGLTTRIRRLRYYPRRLPNAQLRALAA